MPFKSDGRRAVQYIIRRELRCAYCNAVVGLSEPDAPLSADPSFCDQDCTAAYERMQGEILAQRCANLVRYMKHEHGTPGDVFVRALNERDAMFYPEYDTASDAKGGYRHSGSRKLA